MLHHHGWMVLHKGTRLILFKGFMHRGWGNGSVVSVLCKCEELNLDPQNVSECQVGMMASIRRWK